MTAQTPAALQVMAYGYIAAWTQQDYWTVARIAAEIEASGASSLAVAEAVTLAAAALLTDALGGSSLAAETVATRRYGKAAARLARELSASRAG